MAVHNQNHNLFKSIQKRARYIFYTIFVSDIPDYIFFV